MNEQMNQRTSMCSIELIFGWPAELLCLLDYMVFFLFCWLLSFNCLANMFYSMQSAVMCVRLGYLWISSRAGCCMTKRVVWSHTLDVMKRKAIKKQHLFLSCTKTTCWNASATTSFQQPHRQQATIAAAAAATTTTMLQGNAIVCR